MKDFDTLKKEVGVTNHIYGEIDECKGQMETELTDK